MGRTPSHPRFHGICMVEGLSFRIQSLRFRAQSLGSRAEGLGVKVLDSVLRG